MGCTGECTNNCTTNAVCVGFQPTCPNNLNNLTGWPSGDDPIVAGTTIVKAAHLSELETAINNERTHASRRCSGTSSACGSNCPGSFSFSGARGVGDVIDSAHWNNVASAINTTPYNQNGSTEAAGAIVGTVATGNTILESYITSLRNAILNVQSYCICVGYTKIVCTCNVNCVADGASG